MAEISSIASCTPTAEAEEVYRRWLTHLDEEFTRHHEPRLRAEFVRDTLHQIYLGRPHGGKLNTTLISELPGNVLQFSLDPLNVTLEPEYYGDVDMEKYAERKPLIWFWQMFDRSAARYEPLARLSLPQDAWQTHLQAHRQEREDLSRGRV